MSKDNPTRVDYAVERLSIVQRGIRDLGGGPCPICGGNPYRKRRRQLVILDGYHPLCRECQDASPLGAEAMRLEAEGRAMIDAIFAGAYAEIVAKNPARAEPLRFMVENRAAE